MPVKFADEIIGSDDEKIIIPFEGMKILITYRIRIRDLQREVRMLRNEVGMLRNAVSKNVIFVREAPFEEAKIMVLNFIRQHKEGIYTVDIAKNLGLDIGIVLKAISELKEEDKIAKGD